MKKRKSKNFTEIFSLESTSVPEIKEKVDIFEKTDNPNSILHLIAKCEKLIAEIKSTENGEKVEEVLFLLTRLKAILLNLFKKKQRKLLDMHWEEIRRNNEEFSKKMTEQLRSFKKANEK